jgi:hypothetical protein
MVHVCIWASEREKNVDHFPMDRKYRYLSRFLFTETLTTVLSMLQTFL